MNRGSVLRKAGIWLFWLGVWQVAAMLADNEILLVTPFQTMCAFVSLFGSAVFWKTVGMSSCRIVLGFVLGVTLALLLAWASSRHPAVEELVSPIMTLCKAVPVAVFVVLLLIWWGSSYLAVAVCFLIVLPQIYISTLEGLKSTDKKLLEMAKVFEISGGTSFFYIYRPALKPFWDSSLRISLGMCWKSGVAAEVIGTPAFSIGEQLYLSKIHLDTAGVFAWAAVIILLSIGFERVVIWLTERFFRWEPACGKRLHRGKMGEHILHVEHLSKKYGNQQVLQDVSAVYEPDHTYYLTSPSGSGKTTFLRVLCGLTVADSGRIWSEGQDGKGQDAGEPSSMCYSMVFQEDRLCEEYSALRNVEMVTGNRQRAGEALAELLPDEAIAKPCSELSGGMKRRVALVRAMESNSDCVILDEPFTGMDEETRERSESYIRKRQQGRILLIATHILK